jgi:signal transduction histidine kinase
MINKVKFMKDELRFQSLQARIELQEYLYTRLRTALHDKVAQLLGSVNMLLGAAMKDMSQLSDMLNTAHASLRTAIQELRTISRPIQEDWLSHFNALEYIRQEIIYLNAPVKLITSSNELSLSAEKQVILFCIILGILQSCNISEIQISFNSMLEIVIKNDGSPLSETIQQRIQLLQGIYHSHTNGFHIFLNLQDENSSRYNR